MPSGDDEIEALTVQHCRCCQPNHLAVIIQQRPSARTRRNRSGRLNDVHRSGVPNGADDPFANCAFKSERRTYRNYPVADLRFFNGLSGERWKGSSRYLYGCYVMVNFVSKNRIDPVRLTARNFHVERLGSSDYVIIRDDNAIARKHVAAALLRFLSILVEVFDDNATRQRLRVF